MKATVLAECNAPRPEDPSYLTLMFYVKRSDWFAQSLPSPSPLTHGEVRAVLEASSRAWHTDRPFRLVLASELARLSIVPEERPLTAIESRSTIRSEEEFLKAAKHIPIT